MAIEDALILFRLNEVRPGRPEQYNILVGLAASFASGLNEVRPGRPEQSLPPAIVATVQLCLNEVRPGRPEQSYSVAIVTERNANGLNEVRPGRPEQYRHSAGELNPGQTSQ